MHLDVGQSPNLLQDIEDGSEDSSTSATSGSSLESLMAVVSPPKSRINGKSKPHKDDPAPCSDDKKQDIIAKLRARNKNKVSPCDPENDSGKSEKLMAIIAKIKQKHDEVDDSPAPFYPSAQYKPCKPKKTPQNKKAVNPKQKKTVAAILKDGLQKLGSQATYAPGDFSQARLRFIAKHREKTGCSHQKACVAWMNSNKRASLISSLSEAELKRRRFA